MNVILNVCSSKNVVKEKVGVQRIILIQPSNSSNHESVESVEEEKLEDDDMKDVSTTDATTDATTNATTEADAVPSGSKADDVKH